MAERGHGAIVNIGSKTGLRGERGLGGVLRTKAVMHSFTESWADEYGPSGVRVNAVAPGPIATERARRVRRPRRAYAGADAVAADEHTGGGRGSRGFLASDDAANIHGAVLSVDGGWAAT